MIDVENWNAWFAGSGSNGWIYDSITVNWESKKDIKGKEVVSVVWKNKTQSKEMKSLAWKTSLGKALRGCESGFGWVTCASGVIKGFNSSNGGGQLQPQISFSAL